MFRTRRVLGSCGHLHFIIRHGRAQRLSQIGPRVDNLAHLLTRRGLLAAIDVEREATGGQPAALGAAAVGDQGRLDTIAVRWSLNSVLDVALLVLQVKLVQNQPMKYIYDERHEKMIKLNLESESNEQVFGFEGSEPMKQNHRLKHVDDDYSSALIRSIFGFYAAQCSTCFK